MAWISIFNLEGADIMSDKETKGTEKAVVAGDKAKVHAEGYHSHNDDMPNSATIAERKRQRDEVESEIEAFLAQGGGITSVEANLRADPPKKPESNYGSRPI
jgi:hypothetical protein